MDTDLFQGVLLGLLAVGLIVLIALLATLGGIRRALEQRTASRADEPVPSDSPGSQPEDEAPPRAESAQAEVEPTTGYTGVGSYATPAASETTPSATDQADSIRSVLQGHGVAGAEEQATETPAAQEAVVDSAFAAHADDPQEEPFQRDGRWWFRRGDELLLYDEASGQWQPAPEGETPASSGAIPAAAAEAGPTASAEASPTEATATADTSTQTMPEVADQVATFWKCPTCGAVNGSTAATCRMCFAARP